MTYKLKIESLGEDIEVGIRADLSRSARAQIAADYARAGFEEADQTNRTIFGRQIPHTTTVNGGTGGTLESVNPDGGQIAFEWDLVFDVLQWIAKTLIERSPAVSGAYRSGHTLYADGSEIAIDAQIPQAQEFVFANPVPYARKLEVGKTKSGRAFLISMPNKIYERTAKDASARFGNLAKISFEYRDVSGGYQLKHNQAARHFLKNGRVYIEPSQRPDRMAGSNVPSPAIVVRLAGS